MSDQRHPQRFDFGPKPHMSTRLKVASGLSLRKSECRFKSKPMVKIDKECQKSRANMKYMTLCKGGNCDVNDQQTNVLQQAKNIHPKDTNVGLSNVMIAENSESKYSLASKHSRKATTLSLGNCLNPYQKDFNCPESSRVRSEMPASWKSKDDSNATSRCPEQSHHLMPKEKLISNMASSRPTHPKAMPSLIHKGKNFDMSSVNNGALGSRLKDRSNPYREEDINVGKDVTKGLKAVKKKEVSRKSNLVANKDGSNKEKASQDEVMTKEKGMIGHTSEGRATSNNSHKDTSTRMTNEARKNHSRLQRYNSSFMEGSNCARVSSKHGLANEFIEKNLNLPNRVQLVGGNGETNDGKCRRRRRSLKLNDEEEDNGVDQHTMVVEHGEGVPPNDLSSMPAIKRRRSIQINEGKVDDGYQNTYKSKKNWRKDVETNKYEDEMCEQHEAGVENGANELTQPAVSKHCVEQQCDSCSKPIDKPRWSGSFKIDGKEYKSLAGHLSTKSCEKVWKLLLPKVVQVTKVPRLTAWPKIWKASKPTGDSIGLYFFPREMRHDDELDQLVKEVMDKDLVLRAVIDEAEMLIFPSVLLPERHQTFQAKHYLWAAFKAKKDKGAVIVEQEEDQEKHHVSSQLDEVQSEESDQEMVSMKCAKALEKQQLPSNSIQEGETCCVQRPTNMQVEFDAAEETRLRDSSHQAVSTSACTAVASHATTVANAAAVPSEASSFATNAASLPANHGPINPSMEAGPCSSSVFGIVVRQTPEIELKVQQFIQEMEHNGGLVAVMQGEATGAGQWPSNISQPSCSSCRE